MLAVLYDDVKGIDTRTEDRPRLIVVESVLIPKATVIPERLREKNTFIELRPGPSETVDKEKDTVERRELVPRAVVIVLIKLPRFNVYGT